MDRIAAFMAIMVCAVCACGGAQAATVWHVDDDGPADFSTIQQALDAASDGDTIIVRDGCYTGPGNRDLDLQGKAVHLKSENGPENCIIDAQGSEAEPHRCFHLHGGEQRDSIIEGFTLTGGYAYGEGYPVGYGGALLLENSSPLIRGNVLIQNFADRDGGAVYTDADSAPLIEGNTITSNSAARGGAIYVGFDSHAVIKDSTITGNNSENGGDGIYCKGSALIEGNVFEDNRGQYGRALHVQIAYGNTATVLGNTITGHSSGSIGTVYLNGSAGAEVLLAGNVIAGNEAGVRDSASIAYGGAMYIDLLWASGVSCTLTDNVIADNVASGTRWAQGGGIYLRGEEQDNLVVLDGNTITGNRTEGAEHNGCGGALYVYSSGDDVLLMHNVIANNQSDEGGGVAWQGPGWYTWLHVVNNSIVNNKATYAGGGLSGSPDMLITNCILWGNTAGHYPQVHDDILRYCNVEGGRSDTDCGEWWGIGNIDADPLFADPENGDYHLKSTSGRWDPTAEGGAGAWVYDDVTSPCIDAGDPDAAFSLEPLPNGGRINMGAYGGTAEASKSSVILSVTSEPISGVEIGGTAPGRTDYAEALTWQEPATLTAPQFVIRGEVRYAFVRWTLDGHEQPLGQATILVTMDGNHAATALYEVRTQTLSVRSAPLKGILVSGDRPGTTDYSVECGWAEQVRLDLESPTVIASGGRFYTFAYWTVDGQPGQHGQTAVETVMEGDHTLTAVYLLYGDTNGDCQVNVLDLLFVRNRLGKHANTADNWRADVVGIDGMVNVLDLIAVRNELGAQCTQ